MKLIFIWSKESTKVSSTGRRNNFQFREGFTVSSDYSVKYSYEKNEIKIQRTATKINKFYGNNINDVIAIVGRNGAGKTTVLSMLAEECSHIRYEYELYRECIKIFEEEDNSLIIFYCLRKEPLFDVDKRIKITSVNLINDKKAGEKIEKDFSSIFISNNFEWRDFYGLSSIQHGDIIEYNFAKKMKDIKFHPEATYGAELEGEGKVLPKIQTYGQRMEGDILKRVSLYQLRLLVNSIRDMPSSVRQEFSSVYNSFHVSVKDFTDGFDHMDHGWIDQALTYKRCVGYRKTRYFLYACYQLILCEACYFFGQSVQKMIEEHFSTEKEECVDVEFLKRVFEKLKSDISLKKANFDISKLGWYQQLINSIPIFEKYKDERLYIGSYPFLSAEGKRFLEFLSDVLSQENEFFERVITFKSYPASTGESVLANFFAYIYDAINYKTKNKNIAIFIDEIDANLHPKWQQSILWHLLKFLNSLEGYQFQIIFTTHSPIILSDLTEERIIRLERNKNHIKVISDTRQTFGANIMRLYYDDFFMEDGSIGEFAKVKIKAALDYINGKNKLISLDEVNYVINHIGEPTVKKQLKKMLGEMAPKTERELLNLVKEIGVQEAIDCLRQRKKNDSNKM